MELDQEQKDALIYNITKKLQTLEGELAFDAEGLRREVETYALQMAGSSQPEIAKGLVFHSLDSRTVITLGPGEAEKRESEAKISKIVEGCIEAAKDDFAFLGTALEDVKTKGSITDEEYKRLDLIFHYNTFWRLLEAK
jgi:hypothetical protein